VTSSFLVDGNPGCIGHKKGSSWVTSTVTVSSGWGLQTDNFEPSAWVDYHGLPPGAGYLLLFPHPSMYCGGKDLDKKKTTRTRRMKEE